jgi:hypothetical protein
MVMVIVLTVVLVVVVGRVGVGEGVLSNVLWIVDTGRRRMYRIQYRNLLIRRTILESRQGGKQASNGNVGACSPKYVQDHTKYVPCIMHSAPYTIECIVG